MYRLLKPLPYEWSFVREGTSIVPYFTLGERRRIHVHVVELLDENGESRGIWVARNIDRHLLAHICRAIQAATADWEYLDPEQTWGMSFEDKPHID